jgi:hypothetical protein
LNKHNIYQSRKSALKSNAEYLKVFLHDEKNILTYQATVAAVCTKAGKIQHDRAALLRVYHHHWMYVTGDEDIPKRSFTEEHESQTHDVLADQRVR